MPVRPWRLGLAALLLASIHCGGADVGATSESSTASTQADSAGGGLSGNFTSVTCEPFDATSWQVRHYRFTLSSATATWDRFSDPTCSDASKLMTIVMSGSAKVTGLSHDVLGAADITVSIAQKTITPTAAGVEVAQAACGQYDWAADSEQDITAGGCGVLMQQTDDCGAEYDLMKLTSSGLVFGDRSQPLCSEDSRPTELSAFSVVLDPFGYVAPTE